MDIAENRNRLSLKAIFLSRAFLFFLFSIICLSDVFGFVSFLGRINSDNINIRCDSTINSQAITSINREEIVEVVSELYDWYKIRLPREASLFIKKDFVSKVDEKTGLVIKTNVNIRLEPSESSAIVGRADKDEVINILQENGAWYKICPVNNSFGWIYKKFVDKATAPIAKNLAVSKPVEITKIKDVALIKDGPVEEIIVEGVLISYGKVIHRAATHKLITADKKTFLLKGNIENFNSLINRRIKITGKIVKKKLYKYPMIEVSKMELLN